MFLAATIGEGEMCSVGCNLQLYGPCAVVSVQDVCWESVKLVMTLMFITCLSSGSQRLSGLHKETGGSQNNKAGT